MSLTVRDFPEKVKNTFAEVEVDFAYRPRAVPFDYQPVPIRENVERDSQFEETDIDLADGLIWYPWHQWNPVSTTWVDGVLRRREGSFSHPLDIASAGDSRITLLQRLVAEITWSKGSVLIIEMHGVEVVVVPNNYLDTSTMIEALTRAQASALLPALTFPPPSHRLGISDSESASQTAH